MLNPVRTQYILSGKGVKKKIDSRTEGSRKIAEE
jgi:hypothetical protein